MHRYVHTTIKMSLGALITTLLALAVGLDNPVTAGILAVLSIQLTRTDSFILAGKRLLDSALAFGLSTALFILLGYDMWVFFVFTPIFIGISFGLKINEGIVPALVLVSHLLSPGEFSLLALYNASMLMILAIAVALILNSLYPLNTMKMLKISNDEIDQLLKDDIRAVGEALKNLESRQISQNTHQKNKQRLEEIIEEAELADKDILFDKDRRHIAYLRMRHAQMMRIERITELMELIKAHHPYASEIGEYLTNLAQDIGHSDKATKQRQTLENMLEIYREKPLPQSREAFETRAILFQILFELESFLKSKIKFHETFPSFA